MAKRKPNARRRYDDEQQYTNNVLPMNPRVNVEQVQKTFTKYDMKHVNPLTDNQKKVFQLWKDDYSLALTGCAGSGKSFISLYLACQELFSEGTKFEKIIIIRSAVASRDLGYLPGTLEEKTEIFELPYKQIFDDLFKKTNQYKYMKEAGLVEFHTSSFVRGLTFSNAIVIVDEMQNFNFTEVASVITRLDKTSKLVMLGDGYQNDLQYKKSDQSGFDKAMQILSRMPSVRNVTFTSEDIVRGGICAEFIIASENWDRANGVIR